MKSKQQAIFDKAYEKLTELYSGKYYAPDVRIISRFYEEKKILQESEFYIGFLDCIGRLREAAEQKGEEVTLRGTAGSSFIAYLLGATDINPLPLFEYCPHCKRTKFLGEGNPYDRVQTVCSCGTQNIIDGYNIPFESNLKSVLSEFLQVCVSYELFEEAKKLILDENRDKSITVFQGEDIGPVRFCFDKEGEEGDIQYEVADNAERFNGYPRITLVPYAMLDNFRELEKATGGTREKSKSFGYDFSRAFLSYDILEALPQFSGAFPSEIFDDVPLQSAEDLLRVVGLAHSDGVWSYNAERLFYDHKILFRDIPAFREELYDMICDKLRKKGIYETGFAYEVAEKARKGYYVKNGGVDEDTLLTLSELGFDMDFIFFIEKIHYMFPKAHGVAYLKEIIRLMFYKLNFSEEYDRVMGNPALTAKK